MRSDVTTPTRPVVVAFTSSAASVAALRWAAAEARRRTVPLLVVHVDDAGARGDLAPEGRRAVARHDRDTGDMVVERVGRVLGDALEADDGLPPVTVTLRCGTLVEELRRAAENASTLVVGEANQCRHVGLAEDLRRAVTCPVVSVPAASEHRGLSARG